MLFLGRRPHHSFTKHTHTLSGTVSPSGVSVSAAGAPYGASNFSANALVVKTASTAIVAAGSSVSWSEDIRPTVQFPEPEGFSGDVCSILC